ncbi:hypothetical protein M6B38_135145 [Iris pallida]|uniref:Uncharacterized protein n=1 Tax=Iris pallida TaxID=29817 RepID=A0AAX6FFW1_IRIPA|nr:hypothetical protein M6B38_135145 [Iris pallida]
MPRHSGTSPWLSSAARAHLRRRQVSVATNHTRAIGDKQGSVILHHNQIESSCREDQS